MCQLRQKYCKISFFGFDTLMARGSVMINALCYKPEGRGFETR
jgi:hypothetical protein